MSAQPVLIETDFRPVVPVSIGSTRVNERYAKSILTTPKGMISSYDYSMNPYVGCSFGCSYCYAAFFVAEDQRATNWGNWVDVKVNALELLRKEEANLSGKKLYIGSVTDPYQPVESKTLLTRSLLEHMSKMKVQPRVVVQTRSSLAVRDIDIFQRFQSLRVNMTVTTDNDETRKRFEPGCASIRRRLEAVQKLSSAGIKTTVCIAPMLPVTDVREFARLLMSSGATRVTSSYFHLSTRKFAAGTRDNALVLAKEMDWNFEKYLQTASELRRLVPGFVSSETGFGPDQD